MSPSLGDARAEPPLQLARGVEPALCALPSEYGYFVAGRPKTLPYEVSSVFISMHPGAGSNSRCGF
jgi:hypothetical protein